MRKSTLIFLLGLAFLVLGASFAYKNWEFLSGLFGGSKQELQKEMEPLAVEAETVTVRPFMTNLTSVGNLVANESVILKPEISGMISNILFESGAMVKKGQTMYTLEDKLYRAQLADSVASLSLATKDYERAKELAAQKFVAVKELDKQFSEKEKAQAQTDLSRVKLSQTVIKAPFDGYAGIIKHSVGAYVQIGDDLVSIVDLDPMKVDFFVGEEYLQSLSVGQELSLKIDGFDDKFKGEIEAIEPKIDTLGHSIAVRARIDNPEKKLRPGLFATITLTLKIEDEAILIPESAIETDGDEQRVFRVVDGVAVETFVTVGGFEKGMAHITDGLWSYDKVVTAGAMKISDGVPVRIVESPSKLNGASLSKKKNQESKEPLGEVSESISESTELPIEENETETDKSTPESASAESEISPESLPESSSDAPQKTTQEQVGAGE